MGSWGQKEAAGKRQKRCQQEVDKGTAQSPCLLVSACYVNSHWSGLAYQGKMPRLEVQQASWRSVVFQAGPEPEQALAVLCRRVAGSRPKSPKLGGLHRPGSSRVSSPVPVLQPNLGSLSQSCPSLAAVLNGMWVSSGWYPSPSSCSRLASCLGLAVAGPSHSGLSPVLRFRLTKVPKLWGNQKLKGGFSTKQNLFSESLPCALWLFSPDLWGGKPLFF